MRKLINGKIQQIIKLLAKTKAETRNLFSDTMTISIGENCLTDRILSRHGYKSFTTPYSHARSNIDYAIKLESTNYNNLLNPEYLTYAEVGDKMVIRNTHGFVSDPIFRELHRNGFEFTHHDVANNKTHRESYTRKIQRMLKYRGKKNFRFFYHYRCDKNNNLDSLIIKAKDFLSYYEKEGRCCEFNILTQKIVPESEIRKIQLIEHSTNIRTFIFETYYRWAGKEKEIFSARCDDDLIRDMFVYADSLYKNYVEQGVSHGLANARR